MATSTTSSASSSTSQYFPLATEHPYTGPEDNPTGDLAGGAGSSHGSLEISQGALIAIIVVVTVVGVMGISTAALFYVAKKREWKVRETIRRSAKKVVTALTPRRTEFPSSVKESMGKGGGGKGGGRSRDRVRLDDVPPTPRIKPEDLEKGLGVKKAAVEAKRQQKKQQQQQEQQQPQQSSRSNFSRK